MPYIPRELNLVPNTDVSPTFSEPVNALTRLFGSSAPNTGFSVSGALEDPVTALRHLYGSPDVPNWPQPSAPREVDLHSYFTPPSEGTQTSGMRGTQSGPTDESALMGGERMLQGIVGHGTGLGLGALGLIMSGGNPLALGPGLLGAGALYGNAMTPDIHDVWTDRARRWLQDQFNGTEDQEPRNALLNY